jgi:hypothetical protein
MVTGGAGAAGSSAVGGGLLSAGGELLVSLPCDESPVAGVEGCVVVGGVVPVVGVLEPPSVAVPLPVGLSVGLVEDDVPSAGLLVDGGSVVVVPGAVSVVVGVVAGACSLVVGVVVD